MDKTVYNSKLISKDLEMKKKEKRGYISPLCTIVAVQAEYSVLVESIHVTVNKDSSNNQNWANDSQSQGIPNKVGSNPDDSWFGTKDEVAP